MISTSDQDEFIKNYLGHHLPYTKQTLVGDASSRMYEKILVRDSSFVLCSRGEKFDEARDPQLSIYPFINSLGIRTPRILSFDGAKGLVLFEDLGAAHLKDIAFLAGTMDPGGETPASTQAAYRQALAIMLALQKSKANADKCFAFSYHFDVEKFVWELDFARTHVFENYSKIKLTESQGQELDREFKQISEYLVALPTFFTHRDFHSRNLMVVEPGETLAVIDYQDARLGPSVYDLVSLVFDSYVNLSDEFKKNLLDRYFEEQKSLFYSSREKFEMDLAYQKIQRCFKACGSFASLFYLKQKDRYLQYLPGTLHTVQAAIKDLEKMKAGISLPRLKEMIERSIEVGKNR